MPQMELEQSELKIKLANAGFRSESAVSVYLGLRLVCFGSFTLLAVLIFLPIYGFTGAGLLKAIRPIAFFAGLGFYPPNIILWGLRTRRQQALFLSLPDAPGLLVG